MWLTTVLGTFWRFRASLRNAIQEVRLALFQLLWLLTEKTRWSLALVHPTYNNLQNSATWSLTL